MNENSVNYLINSVNQTNSKEFEASERARLIFDAAPLIIEIWNEDFDCIYSNPYCVEVYGLSGREEYERDVYFYLPECQPCGTPSIEFWHKKLKSIKDNERISFPFICRSPQGTPIYTDVIAARMQMEGKNVYVSYSVNNTELFLSQQEAKNATERTRLILESAPFAISFWDKDVKIIDCNENFLQMFGAKSKAEILSQFPQNYTPEYQPCGALSAPAILNYVHEANETGSVKFEWMHSDIHGQPLPCEITVVKIAMGGSYAFAAYARDLREEKEAAAKVDAANARVKVIFDNTPLAISFWEYSGHVLTDCNAEFMKVFETDDKAKILSEFHKYYTPEFQPNGRRTTEWIWEHTQIAHEKGLVKFELVHQDLLGNPMPFEIISVCAEFNDAPAIIAYARDLREERKAEALIYDTNARARIFFEKTPLPITFWDKEMIPVDCNDACVNLLGSGSNDADIKETYINNFLHFSTEFQPCGMTSKDKAAMLFAQAMDEGTITFDWMHLDINGNQLPCEITLIRIDLHDSYAFVAYFHDRREMLASQEKIREANERVRLMLDSTPVACFLMDTGFNAIDCNLAAVSLFEFNDKTECMHSFGNSYFYFCEHCNVKNGKCSDSGKACKLETHFKQALAEGQTKTEWNFIMPRSSKVIPCEINFARLLYKDDFVVAAYVIDLRAVKQLIEDTRKLEIAEENNMAKTRFLARMSHEIRTPLTAIMGISEVKLQAPNLPLEYEEAFAKIYDSTGTLLGIINDILDISKIEANKLEIISGKYEVSSVLIDTLQMHLVYLGSKDIQLAINADADMPAYLIGDELRIKQILNNILSNAIKYTEKGNIIIDIHCEYPDVGGAGGGEAMLVMKITDTGRGMSQEQITALYDEYARFHEKEANHIQGTGLGMPIVYSLVGLMDGTINVESTIAVGTSVTIELPQRVASDDKLGKETAENLRNPGSGVLSNRQKKNFKPEPMPYGSVLVVDDVDTNIYVAKGLMNLFGLKIETAGSGRQAIEKVKSGAVYDIIFMDHMMPVMDGIEATAIIRQLGYTGTIIAFTANALIGQAEEFMKNGFDGFISKPIQIVHLSAILNKYIRDKQPQHVLDTVKEAGGHVSLTAKEVDAGDFYGSGDIAKTIRRDFVCTQKDVISKINDAVKADDLKTARLLAHTLKGVAGLINEKGLIKLAHDAEEAFKNNSVPTELIALLDQEMEIVIKKLETKYKDELAQEPLQKNLSFDKDKTKLLFDELAGQLEQNIYPSTEMQNNLALIPQTEGLIRQIEDFEFDTAFDTLRNLRKSLDV